MEKVSVVVPIYNVENYLEKYVQSVRNQTYKNLEIILVDDGATDSCGQICDRLATEDERIKVVHKKTVDLPQQETQVIRWLPENILCTSIATIA